MRLPTPLVLLTALILSGTAHAAAARFVSINGQPIAATGVTGPLPITAGQIASGSTSDARAEDVRLGRTVVIEFDYADTTDDISNSYIGFTCANGSNGTLHRISLSGKRVTYGMSDFAVIAADVSTDTYSALTRPVRCTLTGMIGMNSSGYGSGDLEPNFPNSVTLDLTPLPYALSASNKAGTLTANIFASMSFSGSSTEYAYLVASYGGQLFVPNGTGWRAYSGGDVPAAGKLTDGSLSLKYPLGGLDPTPLQLYLGYGSSASDMLSNRRYLRVF